MLQQLTKVMVSDYDICRCAVIVESWRANLLRFIYPSGEHLLPLFNQAILAVADKSDWHDPIGALEDYAEILLPNSYKNYWSWRDAFRGLESK
jgi:hypothetical protein